MKQGKLKLVFVKDPDGGYTTYLNELPGIITQVDKKEDAPAAISRVLLAALNHCVDNGDYYEFQMPLTEGGGE